MRQRSRPLAPALAICAVAVIALGVAGTASAAFRVPRSGVIVEGRSIAGLKLGDTRARALAIFGRLNRCDTTTAYEGVTCEMSITGRTVATFDALGHAIAISADNRTNTSADRVVANRSLEVFATRRGVGGGLKSGRLRAHYGKRLQRATVQGFSIRPPLFVPGPAGFVTAFNVVGGLFTGGQVNWVTVARRFQPTITETPPSAGPGGVVHVAARGLLPGAPYRLDLTLPGQTRVLVPLISSSASGSLALELPYDGLLTETLLDALAPGTTPPPAALRLDALDSVDPEDTVPPATAKRPFWLGPLRISAPIQLAAVTPILSVDNAQPLDLSQGLTVRMGGVLPTAVVESGNVGYTVTLDACRGFDLTGDVQGGVLSVPAALTINGQSGLGCTRGTTAPKVRSGTITLTREALGGNPVTLAVLPITYRVETG